MEQTGATDVVIRNRNYNIKPAQVVDEEIDFPEFEFPVSDGGDTVDVWKSVAAHPVQTGNGNGTWGLLQPGGGPIDESPKKMPLAFRSKEHAEMMLESANPFFPSLVPAPATKQQSPLAKFGNLDLDVKHENGKVGTVPSTPAGKSSSTNSKVKNNSPDAAKTPERHPSRDPHKTPEQHPSRDLHKTPERHPSRDLHKTPERHPSKDSQKTPERARPGSSSASALSRKGSGGVRSRGEEPGRALSPSPVADRRNLTSPRRVVSERSKSPVPLQKQDRGSSGVSRSLSPVLTSPRERLTSPMRPSSHRSMSPVPHSKQDQNSNREQQRLGSSVKPASTPNSPRYITPTRAASLKAVKSSPTTTNASLSKELQYPTASGNTTPTRDVVKRSPKDAPAKMGDEGNHSSLKAKSSPTLTQPTGFHFKTDERSEKRRDFYSKLEERVKSKEEEKKRLEAKAQEEKDSQLKELRKSLGYKANPVPKFYQEPPPPPVEFKKSPPTRARSPNFTAPRRRDSCMGSTSETSSSGSSPLRSRLVRSSSIESNGSHAKVSPKVKQPFKPI